MKKIVSLLLAVMLIVGIVPTAILAEQSIFKDVRGDEYFASSAEALAKMGILTGYEDGTFGSERSITRAEMAAVICRMLEKSDVAEASKGETKFTDVDKEHWASGYVNVANKEGIIDGYPDNTFRPDDSVTFEEAVKMVICALGLDKDIKADDGDWSKPYLDKAKETKITDNLKGEKGKVITRGDIAVLVKQALCYDITTVVYVPERTSSGGGGGSKKYTVTFDLNYVEEEEEPTEDETAFEEATDANDEFVPNVYKTVKVTSGKKMKKPDDPEREGYVFMGWAVDVIGEEMFDFSAKIKKNMTLYAVWEEEIEKYTVSFDLNYEGAENTLEKQEIEPNGLAMEPEAPEREGYVFLGWSTDENGEEMFNFNTFITESMVLYAKWVAKDNNNPVSVDDADPDVEIYSFDADVYDILVGESAVVTFTAEIFANIELSNNDVTVVDEEMVELGCMNDNGTDGDAVAGDGVWTLKTEFEADEVGNKQYAAKVNDVVSGKINIGYYRSFTDQDFNLYDSVNTTLDEVVEPYKNEEGYLSDLEVLGVLEEKLEELKNDGIVEEYTVYDASVKIVLSDGLEFKYILPLADVFEGGDGQVKILTFEPFKGTLPDDRLNEDMDKASDGNAQLIADTDGLYIFSGDYDLGDVTLDAVKEIATVTSLAYYSNLINNGSLELWSGNRFAITGGFVKKYIKNMDNTLIYLNTCHSGQDMIDDVDNRYELAKAFTDNGAKAVVGTSEIIYCDYSLKFAMALFERLTTKDDNGEYYTLANAMEWAKSKVGNADGHGTEFFILPQGDIAAMNYRIGERKVGYITGNVNDAETGNAISDALVRVYKNGELINSVRTDSDGYYEVEACEGEYIIKITKGSYKSEKIVVEVVSDMTTYTETFLLVNVGVEFGYANGIISSAISGNGVENVTLKIRSGWNNYYGNVVSTTQTNENGYYEFEGTPGWYTMEYSKTGYITGYKNIVLGIVDLAAQNASISPALSDGAYRITLLWSNVPYDLDSHLTGPVDNSTERFHLYFPMAEANGSHENSDKYTLDLDNTDIVSRPGVFETTTIIEQIEGVYRFSVHNYTNQGNEESTALARSNATVVVYKGDSNVPVATFHVPTTARGTIWTVFELSGDTITKIDRISNGYCDDVSLFEADDESYDEDVIVNDLEMK